MFINNLKKKNKMFFAIVTTMFQYSCHGIPWFIGTATFIFLLQDSSIRQLLVNLFIGKYPE